ncbi:MAG: selenocysteine-specific translation elongation factor [Xanthobacteraceae bacterium]|nr:selenocysteine-specific translation elongation factor [Xanthobacteraceae bacterium]
MIIGTAGHIDHGKTALVGALTGVNTDRLKEEKARGISIDLGFAYLPAPDGSILGFVDVPGHEKFIRNMLAGATGIDFVLLVVAADDGVMPQTLEHLAIVDLLGIRHGMVALTKADLADAARRAEVTAEIADTLSRTALARADIVAVSTVSGEGIDALRAALFNAAAVHGARAASGRFRLAVDRSFTLTGAGTIVTGTVLSGAVAIGDRLTVSPAGLAARVRSIHAQNRPTERGQAGERCALNLVGEDISREAVARGNVVLDPELHAPTARIDATLRVLASERRPISHWLPVRLHHAAAEVGARVALLEEAPLAPGAEGRVQLVLDAPLAAAVGDRFVLRDTSAQRTIGGGRFLDLRAPARRRRTAERKVQLDAHAVADPRRALAALLACAPHYLDLSSFARDRALAAAEMEKIVAELKIVALPVADARLGISETTASDRKAMITSALSAFHRDHGEAPGLDIEQLRRTCAPRFPAPAFRAFVQILAEARELSIEGAVLRLPTHSIQLRPQDEKLFARINPLLSGADRFRPPRVRDIAMALAIPEQQVRALCKQLAKLGRVDEVAPDHFFQRTTVTEIAHMLPGLAAAAPGGEFSAAQLRDRLDNGRKVAIQILEFFDRHGVTARRGDLRRINAQRINLFGPPPEPSKQTTETVSSTAARRPDMAQTPSRSRPSSARTPSRH